jgi:SAM-dependent methyltransferase
MNREQSSDHARLILQQAAMMATTSLRGYAKHYILWKLRLDPVYTLLAQQPHSWGHVLDVGCGPAIVSLLAAARGDAASYTGVDLDETKLRTADRLLASLPVRDHVNWKALRCRLPDDPLPAGPFDTAMLLDVLHYWPVDMQEQMLTLIRQKLHVRSILYLRDGLTNDRGRTGLVGWGERFTTFTGLNPRVRKLHFLSRQQMHEMLDRTGFAVESIHAAGGVNELWVCRVRSEQT